MRTVVVVILLLVPQVWGQAQGDSQNGIVEFYTTQISARPGALVIYSNDQRLGEVIPNQPVRFSGSPGAYRFALRPNAPGTEQVSVTLRAGQQIYLRVASEGFYLGSAAEAVIPLPGRAPSNSANALVANAGNPDSLSASPFASRQNATIFFYRDRQDSNQQVTVYSLFVAGSRPLATLQKGEYVAMSVSPGMNAFSWVPAPARGQTITLDAGSGQQIFVRVQPGRITPIDNDAARMNFEDLQAVHRMRVFDKARAVDEPLIPIQAVTKSADERSRPEGQLSSENRPAGDERAARQQPPNRQLENKKPAAEVQIQQTATQTTTQQKPKEPTKREVKLHGYVTAVTSPTSFEIEDYRITHDEAVTMQFENRDPDVQFNIESVRVGTELDIKGDFDEQTLELRAKTIKVDLEQFRRFKNTVILTRPPTGIVRSENGWTGTLVADGHLVRIATETKVLLKLTGEETVPDVRPLASLQDIAAGMLLTYDGVRDMESGMILADSVEFARNEFEKGEQDLWNRSMVRFKSGDPSTLKPGELTVPGVGKLKILPNDEVQEYVSKIGKSLIPKYALSVPATDPSRFRVQFYVVIDNEPNAYALPNGIFVIHSGMFGILENEAQLAAVMAHEIAHALQEHQWREIRGRKILQTAQGVTVAEAFGRRTLRDIESLTGSAMRNGYTPIQENQADRIGLEYMVNAGYDPREAPKVWAAIAKATGLKGKSSFYDTYDNHASRRSYLMNQIKGNYSDLNFANLRIEETSFRRMTILANEAVSGKTQTLLQGAR